MSYMVSIFLPVWAEGDCIGVRLHSCNAVIEFVLSYSYLLVLFTSYMTYVTCYYSITIVQRYTGKCRKLVSVCIVRVSSMSSNANRN